VNLKKGDWPVQVCGGTKEVRGVEAFCGGRRTKSPKKIGAKKKKKKKKHHKKKGPSSAHTSRERERSHVDVIAHRKKEPCRIWAEKSEKHRVRRLSERGVKKEKKAAPPPPQPKKNKKWYSIAVGLEK